FIILDSKESALLKGNTHGLEIVRADNIVDRPIHFVFGSGFRMAIEPEKPLVITAHGERPPDQRAGANTGSRCQLVVYFSKSSPDRIRLSVHHCGRKRNTEAQCVLGIE